MKRSAKFLLFVTLFLFTTAQSVCAQQRGQRFIDSLLQLLPKQQDDTNKVNMLNAISSNYSYNPVEGMKYGQMALKLAEELNWKTGQGWANNSMGVNFYFRGDYPAAVEHYLRALKIIEEQGNKVGAANVSGNIGNVYWQLNENKKALSFYLKSMETYREAGDVKEAARVEGNIGLVYLKQKEYDKALEYEQRALKTYTQLDNKSIMASLHGYMSSIYQKKNDYAKALEHNFTALKLSEQLGDNNLTAVYLGNMGEIYLDKAKDAASSATEITEATGQSIAYLTKATKLCKETGFLGPLQEFAEYLSRAYTLAGNYKDALESYKEFVAVKDSVFSNENKVKITNLETQRDLELKDKQIEIDKLAVAKKRNERGFFIAGIVLMLAIIVIIFRSYKVVVAQKKQVELRTEELNVSNTELNATLEDLKETQDQLVATEKQKENEMIRNRISQDIHDDISSELTRISWMSEMAKLKAAKASVAEVEPLLEKITTSSRETIGKLGEIIWVVNPDNDNLENWMAYMRNYISRFFTDTAFDYKINFPHDVPPVHINPELKRNLLLVVKECLNNTVKYSQAKLVTITMQLNDNGYILTVADDGKGIEENVIQGGGNGLKNMRSRMASVNGRCDISSDGGKGTVITFTGTLYS